jgi:enediyne polyketide synthase
MGFGGINCHVALESGDPADNRHEPTVEESRLVAHSQTTELLLLSARSEAELYERIRHVHTLAQGISVAELADLSAKLINEVDHSNGARVAICADTPEMLAEWLERIGALVKEPSSLGVPWASPCRRAYFSTHAPPTPPRVGFVFPGQATQPLGMARRLVSRFGWAAHIVERADVWLQTVGAPRCGELLFREPERASDSTERDRWRAQLVETETAQPAITLVSLLWLRYLERLGISPSVVAGHSLGELCALHAAGAFEEETLVKAAALRGQLMAKASRSSDYAGAMVSLRCSTEEAERICRRERGVVVANRNTPRQIVLSGAESAIEAVIQLAQEAGVAARRLPVSAAFHSPQMSAAAAELGRLDVLPITTQSWRMPVVSSVHGTALPEPFQLRAYLSAQITAPVDFIGLSQALARRCDVAIEVGGGRVLTGLLEDTFGRQEPLCLPVESRPECDIDLCSVLGALFVRGAYRANGELTTGRLIRAFVPASERNFIDNPVERSVSTQPALAQDRASALPMGIVEQRLFRNAKLPARQIRDYLDRRAPLVTGLIERLIELDGPKSEPEVQARGAGIAKSEPSADVLARQGSAEPSTRSAETSPLSSTNLQRRKGDVTKHNVQAVLFELIAERTGFPQADLRSEHRMLDDLHLDSIKAADLVSKAATSVGASSSLDATAFANARLGEVVAALEKEVGTTASTGPTQAGAPTEPALTSPVTTFSEHESARISETDWIRSFGVGKQHTPISAPNRKVEACWMDAQVMLVAQDEERGLAVAKALEAKGASVELHRLGDDATTSRDFSDYLILDGPPTLPGERWDEDRVRQMVEQLCRAVRFLPRSAGLSRTTTPCLSWVRHSPRTSQCSYEALDGFLASLHLERPWLRVRSLCVHAESSPTAVVEAVSDERSLTAPYVRAEYDHTGQRWTTRLGVIDTAQLRPRDVRIGDGDVVLVTGGAKGITAECALALGKVTKALLVLVGRASPESVRDQVARFHAESVRATYVQCDVTDHAKVERLVEDVASKYGPVTMVVHGAGLNRPRLLDSSSPEDAVNEIAPKLLGAINLYRVLEEAPPKLFVALSSVIGLTGMAGNAWYALANEYLDRTLEEFGSQHAETDVVSIGFSVWKEVGMAVRLGRLEALGDLGIVAISIEEGIDRFLKLVTHDPGSVRVMVSGRMAGLATLPFPSFVPPDSARFLERNYQHTPGVEVTARAHLSLQEDPYLEDHCFNGSHLFPTVFGLEAMAQAVAAVTGRSTLRPIVLENVELPVPLVVDPQSGLEIEIQARILEREHPTDATRVFARILCESSGFKRDHFSAIFVLDPQFEAEQRVLACREPLGLHARSSLYGPLLFQGPRFQRLSQVWELDQRRCMFSAEQRGDSDWLLGDPYFLDALLQSAQLPTAPDLCLPIRIDRYEVVDENASPSAGELMCEAVIGGYEASIYSCDVIALDDDTRVIRRLRGYRAKVLDSRPGLPTLDEIALGTHRYALPVRRALRDLSRVIAFRIPELRLRHIAGLHQLTARERHQLELPIMEATARSAVGQRVYKGPTLAFDWREDGKPLVKGSNQVDIALAHDDAFCLCVAGQPLQGCDIEPLTQRAIPDWITLLGPEAEDLIRDILTRGFGAELRSDEAESAAGTLVWTACEALRKASRMSTPNAVRALDFVHCGEDAAVARVNGSDMIVAGVLADLGAGAPRVVAVVSQLIHPSELDKQDPSTIGLQAEESDETSSRQPEDNPFTLVPRG